MAKYNWKQLEKEYILSDYKSVSAFLKTKNIPNNGSTRIKTKGWKDKKQDKQDKINTKTIQKVIEKQAEKEAKEIIDVKSTAELLLSKINDSILELDKYTAKTTKKTKKVTFDYKVNKPKEEITTEETSIGEYKAIIDRLGLKNLTSALKDLDDILKDKTKNNDIEDLTVLADLLGFGDKERKQ